MKHLMIQYSISVLAMFLLGAAPFSKAVLHCISLCGALQCPAWAGCNHRSCHCTVPLVPLMDGKMFLPNVFSCLTEGDATSNHFMALFLLCLCYVADLQLKCESSSVLQLYSSVHNPKLDYAKCLCYMCLM